MQLLKNTEAPSLSVVVLHLGEDIKPLQNCVDSIQCSNTSVPLEILVWAQNVPLLRADCLKTQPRPLRIISHVGTAMQGCSALIEQAAGEIISIVPSNLTCAADCLDNLARCFMEKDHVDALTGKIVDYRDTIIEAGFSRVLKGRAIGEGMGARVANAKYNMFRKIHAGSRFSLTLTRSLWDALKGFDVQYSAMPAAMLDLSMHICSQGQGLFYEPGVCLKHGVAR